MDYEALLVFTSNQIKTVQRRSKNSYYTCVADGQDMLVWNSLQILVLKQASNLIVVDDLEFVRLLPQP